MAFRAKIRALNSQWVFSCEEALVISRLQTRNKPSMGLDDSHPWLSMVCNRETTSTSARLRAVIRLIRPDK